MNERNIRFLKGVGEKRAALFAKLNIFTVDDMIHHFPRKYDDLDNVIPLNEMHLHIGEKASVIAKVIRPVKEARIKGSGLLSSFYIQDLEGAVGRIVYFNNKYIKSSIKEGTMYMFYGKIPLASDAVFINPEYYPDSLESQAVIPSYPLVAGLNQKYVRRTMEEAIRVCEYVEPLPEQILEKYSLLNYKDSIYRIHLPKSTAQIKAAKRRFIFEELFYYSLGLRFLRKRSKERSSHIISDFPSDFIALHDFEPTDAQNLALSEIYSDLSKPTVMNRLLQGDVGSGKTLVAGQAAYVVIKSGGQVALMVPTEVLANQHYRYFEKMFSKLGLKVSLLTSSLSAAQKKAVKESVKCGDTDIVIGTHAVIQKDVFFKNLALVITDEQHRFGVMQRSALATKGENPHILVMSATPIPRTLALMLWGDLDLSVIDALPEGRQKVSTYLVDNSYEQRLSAFIKKCTSEGGRAYIVCPMIENNNETDLSDATTKYQQLCDTFGQASVGLVHGRMKAEEKDAVMSAFAEGRIKILVSTTVIEVGVNVPEATLMIIENAERFGLSQLHQLRGRVGRGHMKSYCVLVSESKSERLSFFTKTTDGFKIANKDLELRGPGDFFGRDQHGLVRMKIADMSQDIDIVKQAAEGADMILATDPELSEYPLLKKNVLKLFETNGEIFN